MAEGRLSLAEFLDLQDRDDAWRQYQVPWPETLSERFGVEKFWIAREDKGRLASVYKEGPDRDTGWGTFRRLVEYLDPEAPRPAPESWPKGDDSPYRIWMSDTRAEVLEHEPVLSRLRVAKPGTRVLVNGLGLGLVVRAALETTNVVRVDVVEHDENIIKLVSPLLGESDRLHVHHDDAFGVELKGRRPQWELVWHDIWPLISDLNLEEMARLQAKYKGRARWQGFWQIEGCRAMADFLARMRDGTLPRAEALAFLEGRFRW